MKTLSLILLVMSSFSALANDKVPNCFDTKDEAIRAGGYRVQVELNRLSSIEVGKLLKALKPDLMTKTRIEVLPFVPGSRDDLALQIYIRTDYNTLISEYGWSASEVQSALISTLQKIVNQNPATQVSCVSRDDHGLEF